MLWLLLGLLLLQGATLALVWWRLRPPSPVMVPPPPATDDAVLTRARLLTLEQDMRWPDRSGEAKRHQVYAALVKEYPDLSRRRLSRAIEEAL